MSTNIAEIASSSLRRLKVLNHILNATNVRPPCSYIRKCYSTNKQSPTNSENSDEKRTYVRIGNSMKELKIVKAPEKVPRGYLTLYNSVMSDSQLYLKYLRWLIQKDELKQDCFLIGSPPGAFRRNLALSFAELTHREVEYLCLTRDTTEADIKQRKEISNSSVIYANQCAVNAAINGRILIIEGIEKAERNLLPILNNLLENRELNLDDGHFLVAPERYDKLISIANDSNNQNELKNLNLLRVHEDFRVIAIGLPVPKYKGNLLDPPLRSRFQSHLVLLPSYEDFNKYLISSNKRVSADLIKNLCDFGYSFYSNEMSSLNLPDFPVENLDKIIRIMNSCNLVNNSDLNYNESYLNTSKLITKLYPHTLLLKDEETNKKFYFDLMQKFNLKPFKTSQISNEIDYKLISVNENQYNNKKTLTFQSNSNNFKNTFSIDLTKGNSPILDTKDDFIMNDYHSSQLVDMMFNHSSNHDFCLIGSQGSGKTELIKKFAKFLDYNIQTIYLYKDMSARDLVQQRITLNNGDTKWLNSSLVEAALNGDLLVLDGIHRLKDDTLMSLRRLIQDRELDLLDGTKLLNHDKFDSLTNELKSKNTKLESKILRIHPSFRIVATAEPPNPKSSVANEASNTPNNSATKSSNTEWLNSEVLNLFLYQQVEPLSLKYEQEILSKKFKLNKKHQKLFDLMEQLKQSGQEEVQLRHVSKLFSLRKLVRLSNKLEKYPNTDLKELVENACLYKFMPQLNKQILNEFLSKNNLEEQTESQSINQMKKSLEALINKTETSTTEKSISELAKIPNTLFYENKLHTTILNNLIRDFDLGEHLLLIGNQGTGKNKLVDKFLMLTNKPREYIQLHRDTTVYSLTVQPVIKAGIVYYEDSPLVKAVKEGHVLVIDEADKAPLHVTSILKSLIETGEMILSDGRKIVSANNPSKENNDRIITMNKNFRMIILANRPGFPFLGNDFFAVLGDLLSVHPVDNPDPQSEIEMLRMYAPNVSETVLNKLVSAFGSLRKLSDQGLISYPYSTRELVNIVKHLEKFPGDNLSHVLANVYDFDHFSEQSDLKNTFQQVMHKHGIPIGVESFNINLAQSINLPAILPLQKLNMHRIVTNDQENEFGLTSLMNLKWKEIGCLKPEKIKSFKCDYRETRVDSFSELRSTWCLDNKQQIITDMLTVKGIKEKNSSFDLVYISGIKPISVTQLNTIDNHAVEFDLSDYFSSAWRMYFPRIKLLSVKNEQNKCLIYEETTNDLHLIDFESKKIFQLESFTKETNSQTKNILNAAKKSFSKYFVDQNQTFKMLCLENNIFVSYRFNSSELKFLSFKNNIEYNFNLNFENNLENFEGNISETFKLSICHLTPLSFNSILIVGFDSTNITNSENLKPNDLKYFVLNFPNFDDDSLMLSEKNIKNLNQFFKLYSIDKNFLASFDDSLLQQIHLRHIDPDAINNEKISNPFKDIIGKSHEPLINPIILPSVYNHFVAIPTIPKDMKNLEEYFCRRETPMRNIKNNSSEHLKIKHLQPIVKSIIDLGNNQILTQLTRNQRPEALNKNNLSNPIGYLELIDLNEKVIRYLEIPRTISNSSKNEAWNSYNHLNVTNEAEFLVDLSQAKSGNIYTLDFYGNLHEWETSHMNLKRSLDEWQKIVMDRETKDLKLEIFKESPNKELKEFKGPKHGKVDEKNAPHVGGNQWAGGSGGFDTAGMGGVGGPYRLDSGNQVFQVSDDLKQSVPEHIKKAAREMAKQAFRERLREINMSEYEHDLYSKYLENVKKPIQQLRNILDGLEAKTKERQWLKNQTQGDLDDSKLVEAVTGEKNVYRRRGDDPNADNSFNMEKPKRLKLLVDVSGSMYRFNGVDNRLERQLESVLMVMEAFNGYENKIKYDIYGHSGDGYNIKFVDAEKSPKNEADRLKILKTMLAHAQFCSSGDHTFEATKYAIQEISKEEADDYFVICLSDANFDRYGLSPRAFSKIMLDTDAKVNVFCLFIGTLGDQAINLKKSLPFGKAFVCMNTQEVPKIMQQIFQSAMLNQ